MQYPIRRLTPRKIRTLQQLLPIARKVLGDTLGAIARDGVQAAVNWATSVSGLMKSLFLSKQTVTPWTEIQLKQAEAANPRRPWWQRLKNPLWHTLLGLPLMSERRQDPNLSDEAKQLALNDHRLDNELTGWQFTRHFLFGIALVLFNARRLPELFFGLIERPALQFLRAYAGYLHSKSLLPHLVLSIINFPLVMPIMVVALMAKLGRLCARALLAPLVSVEVAFYHNRERGSEPRWYNWVLVSLSLTITTVSYFLGAKIILPVLAFGFTWSNSAAFLTKPIIALAKAAGSSLAGIAVNLAIGIKYGVASKFSAAIVMIVGFFAAELVALNSLAPNPATKSAAAVIPPMPGVANHSDLDNDEQLGLSMKHGKQQQGITVTSTMAMVTAALAASAPAGLLCFSNDEGLNEFTLAAEYDHHLAATGRYEGGAALSRHALHPAPAQNDVQPAADAASLGEEVDFLVDPQSQEPPQTENYSLVVPN